MDHHEMPLPQGWIEEIDPQSGHPFYVDTLVDPPRTIWVHPYEDELYLQHHPEDRGRLHAWMTSRGVLPPPGPPPPTMGVREVMYEPGYGMPPGERGLGFGGGPFGLYERGFEPFGERRGLLGGMDRRTEHHMRRLERREERLERRAERLGMRTGRYAPPVFARPEYYPGQYATQYMRQPATPPQIIEVVQAPPKEEHHNGGKAVSFLGGLATGVVLDEVYHHHKDKEREKEKEREKDN